MVYEEKDEKLFLQFIGFVQMIFLYYIVQFDRLASFFTAFNSD
jgi:hypothetical protein